MVVETRMAALARQYPKIKPVRKLIYGIRHAEGWHNVLAETMGMRAYFEHRDTTLTAEGMRQAAVARPPEVDFVFVSPLMRTLQTATIMYPDTPKIALECLKEYPQHTHISNRRSEASLLRRIFPDIDFSAITAENQLWPEYPKHDQNITSISTIIKNSKANRFSIITHSNWLKYCMTGTYASGKELIHCYPYELKL